MLAVIFQNVFPKLGAIAALFFIPTKFYCKFYSGTISFVVVFFVAFSIAMCLCSDAASSCSVYLMELEREVRTIDQLNDRCGDPRWIVTKS